MTTPKTAAFLTTTFIEHPIAGGHVANFVYTAPHAIAHVIQGIPLPHNSYTWDPYLKMFCGRERFDYICVYFTLYDWPTTAYLELARQVVKEDGHIVLVSCGCDVKEKEAICQALRIKISKRVYCECGEGITMGILLRRFLSIGIDPIKQEKDWRPREIFFQPYP